MGVQNDLTIRPMAQEGPFVVPLIPQTLRRSIQQVERGTPIPPAAAKLSAKAVRSGELKKSFPERLWRAAMATGENRKTFWVNGAGFADDGIHIFYCAAALGAHLGLKPGTIAHNMRGHLGTEKPRRHSSDFLVWECVIAVRFGSFGFPAWMLQPMTSHSFDGGAWELGKMTFRLLMMILAVESWLE
jgi:hypothetical protein